MSRVFLTAVALATICNMWKPAFVPPPSRGVSASAAGVAVASLLAPAAFADDIDVATKSFSDAAYPLLKQLDWSKNPEWANFLQSGSYDPKKFAVALDKVLID